MKKQEFIQELALALERPDEGLEEQMLLADIPEWDSLAVISFIALVDEHFGAPVEGEKLATATTVADLIVFVKPYLDD
jgi:acyl carrier protein